MFSVKIVFRLAVVQTAIGIACAYMATIELPDDAKDEIEQCQQRAKEVSIYVVRVMLYYDHQPLYLHLIQLILYIECNYNN